MSARIERLEAEELGRHPNGNIEAPQEYLDYEGQVIVRTRFATSQRWKKGGWDPGRRGTLPYILAAEYCTGESDVLAARNDELGPHQLSVYYVDTATTRLYEVSD